MSESEEKEMSPTLNYYSRYNRIKAPKDLASLFNLINGLNIDYILSEEVLEKASQIHHISLSNMNKNSEKRILEETEGPKLRSYQQIEMSVDNNKNKRYSSCQKNNKDHNIRINFASFNHQNNNAEEKVINKSNINIDNGSEGEPESQETHHHEIESLHRTQQSKNKTNLSAMNCLETESIPDSKKEDEDENIHSPIRAIKNENGEFLEDLILEKNHQINNNKKEKMEELHDSQNDQFSECIAELQKVDEMRNSSFHNENKNNYEELHNIEGTQSEKLFRMHNSDIEVCMNDEEVDIFSEQNFDHFQNESGSEHSEHSEHSEEEFGISHGAGEKNYEAKREKVLIEEDEDEDEDNQRHLSGKEYKDEVPKDQNNEKLVCNEKEISTKNWPIQPSSGVISLYSSETPSTLINDKAYGATNSNITDKERKPFKKCLMQKKLNPRLATSTILHDIPVKKVNFKKMMKKETIENQQRFFSPENRKPREEKVVEQNRKLLKAFFDQN